MPDQLASSSGRCLCGCDQLEAVFAYDRSPPGENAFPIPGGGYRRRIVRCAACGHFQASHSIDLSGLYASDYAESVYGGLAGIKASYERILALPRERSDNHARVERFRRFVEGLVPSEPDYARRSVLDVGAGLCVFLKCLKDAGYDCTALDPGLSFVRHAREEVGISALHGDFHLMAPERLFDALSFNKVLEHVEDPVAMLARSRAFLKPGGLVYIELPDGEMAALHGPDREEFFIEHFHAFSMASMAILAARSGFTALRMERLQEPSTKYTLWAMLA